MRTNTLILVLRYGLTRTIQKKNVNFSLLSGPVGQPLVKMVRSNQQSKKENSYILTGLIE